MPILITGQQNITGIISSGKTQDQLCPTFNDFVPEIKMYECSPGENPYDNSPFSTYKSRTYTCSATCKTTELVDSFDVVLWEDEAFNNDHSYMLTSQDKVIRDDSAIPGDDNANNV